MRFCGLGSALDQKGLSSQIDLYLFESTEELCFYLILFCIITSRMFGSQRRVAGARYSAAYVLGTDLPRFRESLAPPCLYRSAVMSAHKYKRDT